jgi:hypothetical protein
MKVDIVACFYRQKELAPFFFHGIANNKECINSVIIVNDEPWSDDNQIQIPEGLPPIVLLDHVHEGFGVAKSLNEGIMAATTDYVFTMSFDVILPEHTLEMMAKLTQPDTFVVGSLDHIDPETELDDFPNPDIIVPDWKPSRHDYLKGIGRAWKYCHNGHNLWHRKAFMSLGGFDSSACTHGRTCEDHEFAVRWQKAFGAYSMTFCDTRSWHMGDRHLASREEKRPTPQARKLLATSLAELYGKRYILFCDNLISETHVNVSHETATGAESDVRADCRHLAWMPRDVEEIIALLPNDYVSINELPTYIKVAQKHLGHGGCLTIHTKLKNKMRRSLQKHGLTTREFDGGVIGYKYDKDLNGVCVDLTGFSDNTTWAIDQLKRLPGVTATVFAYPLKTSPEVLAQLKSIPKIQVAPLGWRGSRNECLAWTEEETIAKISDARDKGFDAPVFRAPDWLLDQEVYNACKKTNYLVAADRIFNIEADNTHFIHNRPPRGYRCISIPLESKKDAMRMFNELAKEANIYVPIEEVMYAHSVT